jgi:glycosyltransferase involved in cell wall biosynthesis
MGAGLPVVARRSSGDLARDGALLALPDDAGADLYAEAITELVSNAPLRRELARRGDARAAVHDAKAAAAAYLTAVLEVA